MTPPHAAIGSGRYALDTKHAGGPLVRPERSQAHQARARRLGAAPTERPARQERFWRRLLRHGRMKRLARGGWRQVGELGVLERLSKVNECRGSREAHRRCEVARHAEPPGRVLASVRSLPKPVGRGGISLPT